MTDPTLAGPPRTKEAAELITVLFRIIQRQIIATLKRAGLT